MAATNDPQSTVCATSYSRKPAEVASSTHHRTSPSFSVRSTRGFDVQGDRLAIGVKQDARLGEKFAKREQRRGQILNRHLALVERGPS